MEDLTAIELQDLIDRAIRELAIRRQADADQADSRRRRIIDAVARLDALLGSAATPPYDPAGVAPATIRGVRKHPPKILAANAGLVLGLTLEGMEVLTSTVRDLALVVGEAT